MCSTALVGAPYTRPEHPLQTGERSPVNQLPPRHTQTNLFNFQRDPPLKKKASLDQLRTVSDTLSHTLNEPQAHCVVLHLQPVLAPL